MSILASPRFLPRVIAADAISCAGAGALQLGLTELPVSMRIVLESVLRNCDGKKVTPSTSKQVANWQAQRRDAPPKIPFTVARVVLQDFTGVPAAGRPGRDAQRRAKAGQGRPRIEPLVPVDLVVDHSIMVDHYGQKDASTST
jgi:aconitate hydratase